MEIIGSSLIWHLSNQALDWYCFNGHGTRAAALPMACRKSWMHECMATGACVGASGSKQGSAGLFRTRTMWHAPPFKILEFSGWVPAWFQSSWLLISIIIEGRAAHQFCGISMAIGLVPALVQLGSTVARKREFLDFYGNSLGSCLGSVWFHIVHNPFIFRFL